jgi:hypothetical protein
VMMTNGIQIFILHEDKDEGRWRVALESYKTLYPSIFPWAMDIIFPL